MSAKWLWMCQVSMPKNALDKAETSQNQDNFSRNRKGKHKESHRDIQVTVDPIR